MTPAPAPTLVPEHATTERIPSPTVVPVPPAGDDLPVDSSSAGTFPNADAAARELARPGPNYTDVVAWLSGHVAGLDRVIYPMADRELPEARQATAMQRNRSRQLERIVRRLHAHLNGDAGTPLRELHRLHRQLLQTLAEHHQGAQALLRQLQQSLPAQDFQRLIAQYEASSQHGPTRPHPSIAHSGLVGQLSYAAAALCDRVLDVLDSRAVHPLPIAHRSA